MSQLFAPTALDFYKVGHINQYPVNTTRVYANGTARSNGHSNIPGSENIVYAGMHMLAQSLLIDLWNDTFFSKPKAKVIAKYKRRVSNGLGYDVDVSHMEALHDLGYLPVEIRSLPEGSLVPYRVPMFTIENTMDEFYWVTNMLETSISAELWPVITAATTYNEYRKNFIKFAKETGGALDFVPFQGHDFSLRGSMGIAGGTLTATGALLAGSMGTDTVSAIDAVEDFYGANTDTDSVAFSVNATEHSVMCAGGQEDEIETFRNLMHNIYPTGILSIVSDTWDFWQVVTEYLPILKDEILARDGKIVIRPDSGDPVKILTGYTDDEYIREGGKIFVAISGSTEYSSQLPSDAYSPSKGKEITEAEVKGLIEVLWDIFGGTKVEVLGISGSSTSYKQLDEHIGAIYGDSITLERQVQILQRLKDKGFSSSNVVLGIGSYTYQYVTRDTHGFAIKATNVVVDGEDREIFKDPKTDDGVKKSAKGLLQVISYNDGEILELVDQVSRATQKTGALEVIFRNGKMIKTESLARIRARVARLS